MARAIGALVGIALAACAQQHDDPCPQLAEVREADAQMVAYGCPRWTACYLDGRYLNIAWFCGDLTEPDDVVCEQLASGALMFDAAHAAACIAALQACATQPCFQNGAPPSSGPSLSMGCDLSACDDVYESHLVAGAPCDDPLGCPYGNCVANETCGGTCRAMSVVGGPCSATLLCAAGLTCVAGQCSDACTTDRDCPWDLGVGICRSGHCTSVPRPAAGEPCIGGNALACRELNSYCDPDTDVCVRRGELGEACDARATSCRAPLACEAGHCVATTHCAPGVGCVDAMPYCSSATGTCTADPAMAACEWLDYDVGYDECPDGYSCAADVGRCVLTRHAGDACDESVRCALGTHCDHGRCLRVAAPGDACGGDFTCGDDYLCRRGICSLRRSASAGEACDADEDCNSSMCVAGRCRPLDVGAPCTPQQSFACQFGCDDVPGDGHCLDGMIVRVDEPCDGRHVCDDGLACLPRADGVAVCRPRCAP